VARHSNAGLLDISVKTVEVHRANLMRKLGARNQTDAPVSARIARGFPLLTQRSAAA